MKFKKLLVSLAIATASVSSFADPASFVVGAILGAVIAQPRQVYVQPVPQVYYQQAPVYGYPQQPPVVISPSQVPMYDPQLHGYCAPYQDEQYAQCMGNMKRKKLEDAYRRGFYGY